MSEFPTAAAKDLERDSANSDAGETWMDGFVFSGYKRARSLTASGLSQE